MPTLSDWLALRRQTTQQLAALVDALTLAFQPGLIKTPHPIGATTSARLSLERVKKTACYQRALTDKNYLKSSQITDPFMQDLAKEMGFSTYPHVVSKKLMDHYIKEDGEAEMFRGVSKGDHAAQFMQKSFHLGVGAVGNGTYCTWNPTGRDPNPRKVAAEYSSVTYMGEKAPDSFLMRMSLKKDAKIAHVNDIKKLRQQHDEEVYARVKKEKDADGNEDYSGPIHKAAILELKLWADDGRVAMMHGYDALFVPAKSTHTNHGDFDQMIILNRTAVRVQRENDLNGNEDTTGA